LGQLERNQLKEKEKARIEKIKKEEIGQKFKKSKIEE